MDDAEELGMTDERGRRRLRVLRVLIGECLLAEELAVKLGFTGVKGESKCHLSSILLKFITHNALIFKEF